MRRSFHTVRERRMLRRIKRRVAHAAEPPRIPGPDIAGPGAEPSSVTGGQTPTSWPPDASHAFPGSTGYGERLSRIPGNGVGRWRRHRGTPRNLPGSCHFHGMRLFFCRDHVFAEPVCHGSPPKERPRTEESSTSCSFHDNAARPRQESPCAYSSSVREGASMPLPGN